MLTQSRRGTNPRISTTKLKETCKLCKFTRVASSSCAQCRLRPPFHLMQRCTRGHIGGSAKLQLNNMAGARVLHHEANAVAHPHVRGSACACSALTICFLALYGCIAKTLWQRLMMQAVALSSKRQLPSCLLTARARRKAKMYNWQLQRSSCARCLLSRHGSCSDDSRR